MPRTKLPGKVVKLRCGFQETVALTPLQVMVAMQPRLSGAETPTNLKRQLAASRLLVHPRKRLRCRIGYRCRCRRHERSWSFRHGRESWGNKMPQSAAERLKILLRDWESQLREWAKPPGKSEQDRCDNAVSAIRNAIEESDKLRNRRVSIFAQGSYRNNTNVRKGSDVDVGILCTDTFFFELPQGMTREAFQIGPATYSYAQYKNDVEEALTSYFGATRRQEAIKLLTCMKPAITLTLTLHHSSNTVAIVRMAIIVQAGNYLPTKNNGAS